jgi:hypothetical protein
VAFWGKGSSQLIDNGEGMSDFRVICDISMGGTHPDALLALGAPVNLEVRYYDGLHAKVYLSDRAL